MKKLARSLVSSFVSLALAGATAAADPVFVSTYIGQESGHGVFRLDDAQTTTLSESGTSHLVVDRDGDVWNIASYQFWTAFKGGEQRKPDPKAKPPKAGSLHAVSAAPGGGLWALCTNGAVRVDETGRWTHYPSKLTKEGSNGGIAELRDGVVIAATRTGLLELTVATKKWKKLRDGLFMKIVRDSNGIVWSLQEVKPPKDAPPRYDGGGRVSKLVGWDGTKHHEVEVPGGLTASTSLAAGKDGRIYAVTSDLYAIDRAGTEPTWKVTKLPAERPGTVYGVDGKDRLWMQSNADVTVVDRQGKVLATYDPGFRGALGDVGNLVVVGNGPANLTSLKRPKATPAAAPKR